MLEAKHRFLGKKRKYIYFYLQLILSEKDAEIKVKHISLFVVTQIQQHLSES